MNDLPAIAMPESAEADDAPEKPKRAPLSRKLRFEVFKRDKFTCQYCGAKAPEAVLHCDHIQPVAEGGTTDILNLITSCQPCNAGKGARPLADDTALAKQIGMLAELEERRQQIEMLLEWRNSLDDIKVDAIKAIESRIKKKTHGWTLSADGKATVTKWLKEFSVAELLAAVDQAFEAYARFDEKGDLIDDTWGAAFRRVKNFAATARMAKTRPYYPKLLYIQGIIRKRSRNKRYQCLDYLEHIHLCGESIEDLESVAKRIRSVRDLDEYYDPWLASIGKTF